MRIDHLGGLGRFAAAADTCVVSALKAPDTPAPLCRLFKVCFTACSSGPAGQVCQHLLAAVLAHVARAGECTSTHIDYEYAAGFVDSVLMSEAAAFYEPACLCCRYGYVRRVRMAVIWRRSFTRVSRMMWSFESMLRA